MVPRIHLAQRARSFAKDLDFMVWAISKISSSGMFPECLGYSEFKSPVRRLLNSVVRHFGQRLHPDMVSVGPETLQALAQT
ncbi:hypothetical protein B0H12DRAFT_1173191 [Mycena haematopus]|nr:hypothetical protein B0H12DRAFT_1173191 [Mycena haematopus]